MNVPENLYYTEEHEWLKVNGAEGLVGVTDHAQHQLGDIVFIEVNTVGETLGKGDTFGTIEAVKTVSDLYMPLGCEIVEFNEALTSQPELVNKDPYDQGWIVKVLITDPAEVNSLLSPAKYKELL